jgi:uncharacterized membrane protein YsdA (DUF1294 family)
MEIGFQSLEGIINLLLIISFLSGIFGVMFLKIVDKKKNKNRDFFIYILFFMLFSLIPLFASGLVCGLILLALN